MGGYQEVERERWGVIRKWSGKGGGLSGSGAGKVERERWGVIRKWSGKGGGLSGSGVGKVGNSNVDDNSGAGKQ